MNIFIPTIGTKLVLNKPWTFELQDESRNYDFWVDTQGQAPVRPNGEKYKYAYGVVAAPIKVTIPAGCTLSVDRIYIRKGNSSFDSVSFRLLKGSRMPHGRFWAKLAEVNQGLDVTVVP